MSLLADLTSEHGTKRNPPISNGLVGDIDAGFAEQVFNVPNGEWEPHGHHHGHANNLR